MIVAAASSSMAGIITASATVILAVGSLLGAIGVAVPLLRRTKDTKEVLVQHGSQLRVIKTLVDGTLTASMRAELASCRHELYLVEELMAIKGETDSFLAEIGSLRRRIGELEEALQDRANQMRAADIEIAMEVERVRKHDDTPPSA